MAVLQNSSTCHLTSSSFLSFYLSLLSFFPIVSLSSFLLSLFVPLCTFRYSFLLSLSPNIFFTHRYLRNADVWSQKEKIFNLKNKFVINNFYWNSESQNRKLWYIFCKSNITFFKTQLFPVSWTKGFSFYWRKYFITLLRFDSGDFLESPI